MLSYMTNDDFVFIHGPFRFRSIPSSSFCLVCRADLNQDFNQVPILVPTEFNNNETTAEADQGGGGESEIEWCLAREGQRKDYEDKTVSFGGGKWGVCGEVYAEDVRKYILLNHGVMQRSASNHVVMLVVGSSRKRLCWSDSEGSSSRSKRNSVGLMGQGSVTGKNLK